MTKGTIAMSAKERLRLEIMGRVDRGELTLARAAAQMGVSYRQAKRIRARFREQGAKGLVHRGRGQPGNRGYEPAVRQTCLEAVAESYADFGPTLIAEKLAERHDLRLDHETVRRWMIEEGRWQTRPGRKHRRRRKRRERFGELVQIDGSPHAWFEDRGPACCLMVMIDDATGKRMARFDTEETARVAMELMRAWVERHGIPEALYADRKNTFVAPARAEERNGAGAFVRACVTLGVPVIPAGSPQAKGRVERSNRVFQDRLVKELRLAGIDTIEAANAFLETWMDKHSRQFEVPPACEVSAHRNAGNLDLGAVFAWHYRRSLLPDFTVRLKNRWYQVLERDPMPRPKNDLTLRMRLDGTLEILDAHGPLSYKALAAQPTPQPPEPKAAKSRKPHKPAANHPWRNRRIEAGKENHDGHSENERGTGGSAPGPPEFIA
jgi:transposase